VTDLSRFGSAIDRRRRVYAAALGAASLPLVTLVLTGHPLRLSLANNLLIYLLVVVAVAVVGGFWPAVASAIAASLLLNWYFTRPFHTFTIAEPTNLLALLLFVLVAVCVSSVVHLAARRAQQAARSRAEAEGLLRLARSVLSGDDTPAAVLSYLHTTLGIGVQLLERCGASWVQVAVSGDVVAYETARVAVRDGLQLVLHGEVPPQSWRLVEAGAGQCAAALDRDRLRTQAAQAEALAAGNRMRTALLAAVSHDLRTPLASIKASVSSLRQTDVAWSPQDEAALLETVEESADRLDALIANLLDMTRVHTGALQPYLQPAAIDEVAPLALRGLPDGNLVSLDVPEDLPLVQTDAGLLERALANLCSNALRYSPIDQPPRLVARLVGDRVEVAVVDHGPGVAVDQRERMFEPFQRLGDRDITTGVGLGLAVARGFVEALGGRLSATETGGGGLTMTVSLPTMPAHVQPAREPQP
jgi:two-component system sensor histidine kinase KdpD